MVNVTKAYLPPKEKYDAYTDRIFESGWLTNRGSLLQELETRLADHLGVKHLICVANGSLALQLAYKALSLSGEVITTPFSFAATTSTLDWEGLKPVFADISERSLNLDPDNIEPLITDKTSAIVPVHVFGNPCDVEAIASIAKKYNLKVVYDAAHVFGVDYKGQSILNYGEMSTVSFHSTKLFHTIEGGAVVTNNDELAAKVRLLINFGITGPTTVESPGTNAKMNEFEAAMGHCVLDDIGYIERERKKIWSTYQNQLGSVLVLQEWRQHSHSNGAYAPVVFDSEAQLLNVETKLKSEGITPRRYFYPSLDTLEYLKSQQVCQVSRSISSRILCLPIYPGLSTQAQTKVIQIIKDNL